MVHEQFTCLSTPRSKVLNTSRRAIDEAIVYAFKDVELRFLDRLRSAAGDRSCEAEAHHDRLDGRSGTGIAIGWWVRSRLRDGQDYPDDCSQRLRREIQM